jgi:hypothetical protein
MGSPGVACRNGSANTGEGGAGGIGPTPCTFGGTGGSGIVVVRVPSEACVSVSPGANTVTSCVGPASEKVATFTVSGTLTIK